eukprot:119662-Amphidinium_carterae.2
MAVEEARKRIRAQLDAGEDPLADYWVKSDSARVLCAEFATKRPDFAGLQTGLSTQSHRHLKKTFARVYDRSRSAVNAALGGVWHEVRTNSAFAVGFFLCALQRGGGGPLPHHAQMPSLA